MAYRNTAMFSRPLAIKRSQKRNKALKLLRDGKSVIDVRRAFRCSPDGAKKMALLPTEELAHIITAGLYSPNAKKTTLSKVTFRRNGPAATSRLGPQSGVSLRLRTSLMSR